MTIVQNRRDFIGIAAGVALATGAAGALAQGAPKTEYAIKKLPFDPARIKGLSEKLLVSHYENNYSGAVKRLNAISAQLASLDMANAPVFVVNGLKREELIAANSMIIHELYFDGLGGEGEPDGRAGRSHGARFRQRRALEGGVRRHGPRARRRLGLGPAGAGRRATSG